MKSSITKALLSFIQYCVEAPLAAVTASLQAPHTCKGRYIIPFP